MTLQGSVAGVPPRKILFATDFSPCSEIALQYGLVFSRRYHAILYLVSVVSAELVFDARPPDPLYLRHTAEAKMAKLAASHGFQGIKHIELVENHYGSVSDALLELVDPLDIDLIVLGTPGCSGIKQLALGSVTEEIVNRAPCAVLTIGPHVPFKSECELTLQRLLCAVDLGPGSSDVLSYALWVGKDRSTQLTLLHVLSEHKDVPSQQRAAESEAATKKLMQFLPLDTNASFYVQAVVEIGRPADQILKLVESRGVDLIVIGRRHTSHPRVSAHLPWAMLHQVVSRAPCPVLNVQAGP